MNAFIGERYNKYICPVQPCRHLTLKLVTQGHPQRTKVPHVPDFKSAYIFFIIGPRGLQCETNLLEIKVWESSDVIRFNLGPLVQDQTRTAKLNRAYNLLIIGHVGLQCETNLYRK